MSEAFTDADYERVVRERDEAFARIDSQRSQIAFYRNACTARFLPDGFGDETIRGLINDLMEDRDDARSTIEDLNDEIARGREAIRIYRTETEAAKRERDLALGRLENEIKAAKQARMAEERARESLDELDAAIYECLPSDYDDDSPLDCVEHAADRLRDLAQERDELRADLREFVRQAENAYELLKPLEEGSDAVERAVSHLLTVLRGRERPGPWAFDVVLRERDEARANYQWMVDRACDEKLEGYRELAAKCAQLEEERDEARAEVERLREMAHDFEAMREDRDHHASALKQERREVERLQGDVWALTTTLRNLPVHPSSLTDACTEAYHRGAEAMRETAMNYARKIGFYALMADIRALPIPEET